LAEGVSIEERFAIQDLLLRYCYAVDTLDTEACVACFTPDGVFRSAGGFRYENSDGIRRFMDDQKSKPVGRRTQHWVHPIGVRADGAARIMRSYGMTVTTDTQAIRGFFYSDDTVVKVDGAWRIKDRFISPWDKQGLPPIVIGS
jgi:uncharacterized protein (TIGR02246 family)